MEWIYLDNHLLIAKKPAGLATQPDLHLALKDKLKAKFHKPGNVFLEPIHRLDKPVQGMVLFARTSKALSRLNQAMREKKINKIYCALVEGNIDKEDGVLEHFLIHDEFKAQVVKQDHPEGKRAVLYYKVLKRMGDRTLVQITLETGRYHQIRAQFAKEKHPIIGDRKYGSKMLWKDEQIALWNTGLQLDHPVTLKPLMFELEFII